MMIVMVMMGMLIVMAMMTVMVMMVMMATVTVMVMNVCKCWGLAYHANPLRSPLSCRAFLNNRIRHNEETQ